MHVKSNRIPLKVRTTDLVEAGKTLTWHSFFDAACNQESSADQQLTADVKNKIVQHWPKAIRQR
jgi:hypothetical protein